MVTQIVYAVSAFLLASGLALAMVRPIVALVNFFYISFPIGLVGVMLLILRASIGILFVMHGYPKVTHLRAWAKALGMPVFLCFLSAYSMFLSGFCLIAGFLTPLASLAILVSIVYAMFMEMSEGHPFVAKDPFQIPEGQYEGPLGKGEPPSYEKAFLYNLVLIAIAVLGPGAYSLDALLFSQ